MAAALGIGVVVVFGKIGRGDVAFIGGEGVLGKLRGLGEVELLIVVVRAFGLTGFELIHASVNAGKTLLILWRLVIVIDVCRCTAAGNK